MFTKKIKSLIAPIAILGAFTFLAASSSSTSSISEEDAYDAGYKIGEGLHHLLNDASDSYDRPNFDMPKDSVNTNQLVCYN
ncbi:MAG: hypothetical protein IJE73_07170 [Muribaculaceae bacterium]|nr:hypothetical protein [Muribaculaceae bacterium]